ncbi:MAG: 16S rRNA (adenine(1518)-N(6)/adenine(1519)-N(6))-dimethyltransferase RsmA [Ignavibacteria bacterium]|nr:16S rRNA (adenine(1518)-N(6)/adenine(1519)-N(6))-dimethyltransferase RsmA [Ignavibacteria bacterium]
MNKYKKYKPIKFLGQNFLVDDNIAKKIVNSGEIKDKDLIIEIGPGYGALTKYIIEQTNNYIGVEIDQKCIDFLREKFGNKIILLNKDFLKFDFENDIKNIRRKFSRLKVISNIPYNITSEILFKLFENKCYIHSAILMTQKEVAMRLNAKPKTKEYGILTVHTQLNSDFKLLFHLPPTVFFPRPKVESSVFKLTFHNRYKIENLNNFSVFIKSAFGKRRKILRNSLKEYLLNYNINNFDFDFSQRAEELSPQELLTLYNRLRTINKINIQ